MFKRLCIQFWESYRMNGLVATFREIVFINRELIVMENDLSTLGSTMKSLPELNMEFIEISKYNFEKFHLKYPFRSRYLKALKNLNNGFRSFVVSRGNEVIGDTWCATSINSKPASLPVDLKWFGIDLGEKGAYLFDMFVNTQERKNSVAIYLISLALHSLREKGFIKIYGYVWVDNSQASFLYRIFRFKELKRMKASRFLFFKRVRDV